MKFNQLLQRLFGSKQKESLSVQDEMQADKSAKMQKMMAMLSNTQEIELTCDDVFAILDQFVEMTARGEDISRLMPLVKHHLDMCPDCMEEYRVLESIVQNN
jgi:ribosome assembly protein YihI (activator of Der GTPase)